MDKCVKLIVQDQRAFRDHGEHILIRDVPEPNTSGKRRPPCDQSRPSSMITTQHTLNLPESRPDRSDHLTCLSSLGWLIK